MNEERIRRLVKIVEESNIAELEVTRWGKTIKISKIAAAGDSAGVTQSVPVSTRQPAAPETVSAAPEPEQVDEAPATSAGDQGNKINAPMVGTFYRAPAPDADPYVEVGQTIKKGQVLCIIEAMKLMNEIESEYDGKIVDVLAENGQPVEYNQPLFVVER